MSRAKITDPSIAALADQCGGQQDDAVPASPARVGRPPLPPEKVQSKLVRERVTEAQFAEYQARGGKAWLIRELGRKARS